jgi:arylformamidase
MVPGRDIAPYLERYAAAGVDVFADPGLGAQELAYGDHPDEVLTWVPALGQPATALTFVFIHGGYWRALSHHDGLSGARAMAAAGVDTVSINYTLAPAATLEQVVDQCRRALRFIVGDRLPVSRDRLVISGHSAGGHLAAMVHDEVPAAPLVLVSGVFDLEPLLTTTVNEPLGLDVDRAVALSPMLRSVVGTAPALVLVGARDTDHFKHQSRGYADVLRAAGRATDVIEVADRDHFDVIEEFARPESPAFRWVMAQHRL